MSEEDAFLAAARAGDHAAFAALIEPYRHRLHVHCYRMLGSFDDAEDLVQETLLRAWRGREGFQGRSLLRTWLYRIATNACLNALERAPRRVMPQDVAAPITAETPASEARPSPQAAPEVPWLQPYPDALLGPDELLSSRESVGLAFLAALQHLPPRQRAILLLHEVVGWSAAEVAEQLEITVPAVNSALQRARAGVRLPTRERTVDDRERAVLQGFVAAWEKGDAAELTALLREDARWAMPPAALWFDGRGAIEVLLRLFPPGWKGRAFRMLPVGSNGQPAAAAYVRMPGDPTWRFSGVHVLRVEAGSIAEITTFGPGLCARFGLPDVLDR